MRGCTLFILTVLLLLVAVTAQARQKPSRLRIGYLNEPGSALVLLAAQEGHLRHERLAGTLDQFATAEAGLAALAEGRIDAGAFPLAAVLKAIAANGGLQIIAGGGTPNGHELEAALNDNPSRRQAEEVVTVTRKGKTALPKETATRLVTALIRAYRDLQPGARPLPTIRRLSQPLRPRAYTFDPNPDYYRFAATWTELGLQRSDMRRDYLAGHVFEEVYCDALDRAVDAQPQDAVLQKLASIAVCVPDCCPDAKKRKAQKSKGETP
jgi:hypothetical protein